MLITMKAITFFKSQPRVMVNNPMTKSMFGAIFRFALSAVYGVDSHAYDYIIAWIKMRSNAK